MLFGDVSLQVGTWRAYCVNVGPGQRSGAITAEWRRLRGAVGKAGCTGPAHAGSSQSKGGLIEPASSVEEDLQHLFNLVGIDRFREVVIEARSKGLSLVFLLPPPSGRD